MGNISKRRRLKDLYVIGYSVHFSGDASTAAIFDDKGTQLGPTYRKLVGTPTPEELDETYEITENDEVVFVQAPSPLQREQALREAGAMRARIVLQAKDDADNDIYGLQARAFLAEMDDPTLIEYVLNVSEGDRYRQAQREVLGRKEWKDFDNLRDMMRQWEEAGSPTTDEWQPLLDRDLKFGQDVSDKAAELREGIAEGYRMQPRAELERKALDRRLEIVGNQEFMIEYEKQMLYFSCRDPKERSELYFEDTQDLLSYDEFVQSVLTHATGLLLQTPEEVRGLSRAAHGSESAVPPASPETSPSFTHVVATV